MRTIEQMRARLLDELHHAFRRPGMYAGGTFGVQLYFHYRLHDLAFIDDREEQLQVELTSLQRRGMFRATGVAGGFDRYVARIIGPKSSQYSNWSNETCSVYAEIAHRLGYLKVDRKLSKSEWSDLQQGLRTRFKKSPAGSTHVSNVIDVFGIPSLSIGGNWLKTICYAPGEPGERWVCFDSEIIEDFFRPGFSGDPANDWAGWHKHIGVTDRPLRTIRWQTDKSHKMFFTPYGKWLLRTKLHALEKLMVYNRELEIIEPKEREVVMQWTNEWIERGKLEGRVEGRVEGRRETIVRQLRRRFGPLPVDLSDRIARLDDGRTDELVEAVLDFQTIGDAIAWVDKTPVKS